MKKSVIKKYVVSSLVTFVTTFIFVVAVQIDESNTIVWEGTFWLSIIGVGLRAGVKAVAEYAILEKKK